MRIGIAQINPVIGDFTGNGAKIIHQAEQARTLGCDLVIFSELAISGYPPRDLLEKRDFIETNLNSLQHVVQSIDGIGVILGYAAHNTKGSGNPLYNAAVLFEQGRVLHKAYKRLLPTYDVFDERRYFEPGEACQAVSYKGRRLGLTICEDVWTDTAIFEKRIYRTHPVERLVADGADLIINISASPFHIGKPAYRWQLLRDLARTHKVPVIYANQVGGNDSVLFDGASTAFDRNGEMVARAADFKEDLVVYDTEATPQPTDELHPVSESHIEALHKALAMGTRDYIVKCGFTSAVIGLSGGIDSALTACVAANALGPENVLGLFMPSRYTSSSNYTDTEQLARNLGIHYRRILIDDAFQTFTRGLALARDENNPGLTEQNLQARIRGTLLMACSNEYGHMVLATGNKSELAVGYCTLYGDMCGGLAVISDVPKTVVYELSRFINQEQEIIPRRIITKPPSAELKPDQTDQDDLPPYEILDAILTAYIEESLGYGELVAKGYDAALVADIIRRIDQNEYKRHQAPPGLKVSAKAFGYGRRYPMAQRYKPQK